MVGLRGAVLVVRRKPTDCGHLCLNLLGHGRRQLRYCRAAWWTCLATVTRVAVGVVRP